MRNVSQAVFTAIGQFLTPDTGWEETKPIIAGIVDALARAIAMLNQCTAGEQAKRLIPRGGQTSWT